MTMKKKIIIGVMVFTLLLGLTGCGSKSSNTSSNTETKTSTTDTGKLVYSDIFTDRDLEQTVDTSNAIKYTVKDGEDITITKEGVYVISGSAQNVSIIVDADDEEKVQLVLDDLTITNESKPCIYVKNADKAFVNITGDNNLSVTGTFASDGDTNTDAVIFSKDDIVLNGTGNLTVKSTDNGITSKDDLKITGGTINITSTSDALEANNSIAIADGNITINSKKDGLHAEYSEDDSQGYVYIAGGTLNITATDDAIHATTITQINDGNIKTSAREGIEATYVQINGGTIDITASDDGINAAAQSKSYTATVEITGGSLTIDMGQGDTDAVDSNGYIYVSGGTINITAQSAFDYDQDAKYTGGTIIVNGEETNEITNQMMGGGNMQNVPQGVMRR